MRKTSSLVLASLASLLLTTLTACGDHERPRAAVLDSDFGANKTRITVGGDNRASGDGESESEDSASEEAAEPTTPSSATCTPKTCAQQGFACGTLDDGCGGTEECGECTNGLTCSNGGGGTCASVALVCKTENMRLLGSCISYDDAHPFASGAACEEFYDSTPGMTTTKAAYACDCAHGVWEPQACSARVSARNCFIGSSATSCSRTVSCFAD